MTNENASRGILVTTSHFGNNSKKFAEGKPITLIDGQGLLALMQKYGFENVTIKLTK
jgi:restriction system protein